MLPGAVTSFRNALTKRILLCGLLLLALCMGASAQAGQTPSCGDQPVRMADQTWESASFTTQLIRLILTYGYGCDVDVVPGTTAATESALALNDLHIIAEQWSGRSPIIEQGIEKGDIQTVGDTLKGVQSKAGTCPTMSYTVTRNAASSPWLRT